MWWKGVINYFTDWTCKYKRWFWGLLAIDGPLATFDLGITYAWFFNGEILTVMGKFIGIVAGLMGCWLTYLRIKHFPKEK